MNGKWTYANAHTQEWVHELYDTKEEAIKEGKLHLGENVSIGKLRRSDKGHDHFVEDIETF